MNLPFMQELGELKESFILMDDRLSPLASYLNEFKKAVQQDVHWNALRALTVGVNRFFSNQRHLGVCLVTIYSLLYLSDHIHCQVMDDAEGQKNDQKLQFSILIGDFIFGEAVRLLGEMNSYHLLPYFADLICQVNEGHVMRRMENDANIDILALEKGSFYRYAFLTAALMAGTSSMECHIYEEIGFNLGMALALKDSGMHVSSLSYLDKAKTLLITGIRSRNEEKNILRRVIEEVFGGLNPSQVVAL